MIRLLLLLALCASAAHAQTWELLNPSPTGNSYSDIQAIGDGTYYLAGGAGTFAVLAPGADAPVLRTRISSSGGGALGFADSTAGWVATGQQIFRTTDAGQSWTLQYESDRFSFTGISATDAQNAWAVGRASFADRIVVRTTDGGATWTEVSYPIREGADSQGAFYVRAFDAQTAVAVDYSLTVYRTTDGGASWDSTHVPAYDASFYEGAFFTDTDRGWLVGPNQTITATVDGGETWTRQLGEAPFGASAQDYLTEIHFADASNGWATSFGCLYRTQDGGQTWTEPACDDVGRFRDTGLLVEDGGTRGFVLERNTILRSTDSGASFTNLSAGYRESIRSAAFLSGTDAWAATGAGDVLRTTDGWDSFEVAYSDATTPLQAVDAASEERGWAVGSGGAILTSTDGGDSWTAQTSGVTEALSDVAALSATSAIVVGNAGTVLATADGGATWTSRESGVTVDLNSVHFADGQTGWIAGDDGTMLTTADGGATWTAQDSGTLSDIAGVYFPTPTTGFAYVFFPGSVLGTTDGGATWTLLPTPPEGRILTSLFFLDDQTGWVGGIGLILHTTDGGASWTTVPDYPFDSSASDIYFTSADEGWVFGSNGTVLGYSSTATAADPTPDGLARLAVYPNPSAGPATLALALGASAEVTLTVHDALGRAVARQRLALGAGEHRLALPDGLAPGLYVAVAEAGGERLGTARFTVVR